MGVKGHFPPGIMFTPQVDLYDIESTNRDSISAITGTRFNVPQQYIPGRRPRHRNRKPGDRRPAHGPARGIATLPGGVPLYKQQPNGKFAGGQRHRRILPRHDGICHRGKLQKLNTPLLHDPHKLDLSEVAEYMAFVAAGGSSAAGLPLTAQVNVRKPALSNFTEPFGRIDLAGITLDLFGGHGLEGPKNLLTLGGTLGKGDPSNGTNYAVDAAGDTLLAGQGVPYGWLVTPHTSPDATAADPGPSVADIEAIVAKGIAAAGAIVRPDPVAIQQHDQDGLRRQRHGRQHP